MLGKATQLKAVGFVVSKVGFNVKLLKLIIGKIHQNDLKVLEYELTAEKQEILYIPNGFVNGFKGLKADSKLMIMSNYRFNEIENDQIRFDQNKWTKWESNRCGNNGARWFHGNSLI